MSRFYELESGFLQPSFIAIGFREGGPTMDMHDELTCVHMCIRQGCGCLKKRKKRKAEKGDDLSSIPSHQKKNHLINSVDYI